MIEDTSKPRIAAESLRSASSQQCTGKEGRQFQLWVGTDFFPDEWAEREGGLTRRRVLVSDGAERRIWRFDSDHCVMR